MKTTKAFLTGVTDEKAEDLARQLGLESRMEETVSVIKALYTAFISNDASMIEINPYAEDTYGKSKWLWTVFCLICFKVIQFTD